MSDQPADQTQPIEGAGSDPDSGGGSKRTPIIVGVSVLVVAVLAALAYAGVKLSGGGSQPAEALPDSVIAYASVDIDPGAKQKIEAIRTMRKFPDLRKQLNVDEKDDVRKKIFNGLISGTGCEDKVDFDKDIEPWLGDRAAVAAADLGDDEPTPVVALQVNDEKDAKKGVEALRECASEDGDKVSYGFNGDYLVFSQGDGSAQKLIKAAESKSLADDKNFTKWSDEAGGDGIVSFYVSQRAAEVMVDSVPPELAGQAGDLDTALKEFKGMAGALRFADSGLELEIAAEGGQEFIGDAELGEPLSELPKDTAIALGMGVPDDFGKNLVKQLEGAFGADTDSMVAQAEAQSGLDLPEDLETLLGDAVMVALGGDAPERMQDTKGPSDVPFGVKIIGDADKIKSVVKKAEERAGRQLSDSGFVQSGDDDVYVLASNDEFAKALADKGSLGENENFKEVVPDADKSAFAIFVDFDSAWRQTLINSFGSSDSEGSSMVEDNTEPLGALGISGWRDGKVSHGLLKLTTD